MSTTTKRPRRLDIQAAALADLLAGEQPAVVAQRYGLDPALVRQWKRRYVTPAVTETAPVTGVTKPLLAIERAAIGELVLDLLRAKLEAAQAVARTIGDPAWLRQQTAGDLAELGAWLDSSILALGDRLAARAQPELPDEPA